METLRVILLVILVVVFILSAILMGGCLLNGGLPPGAVGGGPFRLKVSDPEYTALLTGVKTIEARLDRPPFSRLEAGEPIVVVRSRPQGDTSEYPGGRYKFDAEVVRVERYKDLAALLKAEGVEKVYPGHKTASSAADRFGVYLPPGASPTDPVMAIEIRAAGGAAKKGPKKAAARASYRDDSGYDDEY
jgi:ASC-1-like (ASCH) protein